MVDKIESHQRRRFRRFRAEEGAYVALKARKRKLWQILDIGMGGLAFRYIPLETEIKKSSELEITTRDTLVSLGGIPYRSISDCEIHGEFISNHQLRRHSVQFGKMTGNQLSRLEYFFQNHTVGQL